MKTNVSTLFGTLLVCAVCAVHAEQAPQIESLQLEAKEIGASARDKIVSAADSAKEVLTPSESTTRTWKDTMQTMQTKAANAARSAQEMAKSTQQLAMDNKLATAGIIGTTVAMGGGAAYYLQGNKAKKVENAKAEAEQHFRDTEVKNMLKQARKVGAGMTTLKQSTFQQVPPQINDMFTDPMNLFQKGDGRDAWKERLSNHRSNTRAEEQFKAALAERLSAEEQYSADKVHGLVHQPKGVASRELRAAIARAKLIQRKSDEWDAEKAEEAKGPSLAEKARKWMYNSGDTNGAWRLPSTTV